MPPWRWLDASLTPIVRTQEMGDLAVYLRAGMSRWQAVGLNLLSALTAYIGAILVLGLSEKFREEMNTATIYLLLFAGGESRPAPRSVRLTPPAQASSCTSLS